MADEQQTSRRDYMARAPIDGAELRRYLIARGILRPEAAALRTAGAGLPYLPMDRSVPYVTSSRPRVSDREHAKPGVLANGGPGDGDSYYRGYRHAR